MKRIDKNEIINNKKKCLEIDQSVNKRFLFICSIDKESEAQAVKTMPR